jgi:hypothetical protein
LHIRLDVGHGGNQTNMYVYLGEAF